MDQTHADRIARLERRVAELETRLGVAAPAPAAPRAPVPPVAATLAASRPVVAPPAPALSFSQLEEQLSSRLLAWVGGIALVVGAMFFLSLAFSRGWIGPELRVLIGLVAGAAALVAGTWLFERGIRTPATVLSGVGIGTGSLALFAASRLYGFIPVELALGGFLLIAVCTSAIALRAGSQAVAAFGIIAVTLAPPVLGASPNLVTVAFLGAALLGTASLSFGRSWPRLALLAFVAIAPQAMSWLRNEESIVLAVAGITAFWTLNALAATGPALVRRETRIHRSSATLLVLNALFAITIIHSFLPLDTFQRSVGLAVLGGLHGAIGAVLLLRPPSRNPYGVLVAGLAAGTLAVGIAIELGGVARPIGLTALALAVGYVAITFRDRSAAAWAAGIASVALWDLTRVQYPLERLARLRPDGIPFASPEGAVAILIAAALALAGLMAWRSLKGRPLVDPMWTPNLALTLGCAGALAVLSYAATFELAVDLRVVGWAVLGSISFGLGAAVRRDRDAWMVAAVEGSVILGFAAVLLFGGVVPPSRLLVDPTHPRAVLPLFNRDSLAILALALSLVIAGRVASRWSFPRTFVRRDDPIAGAPSAAAGAVLVYLCSVAIVDAFQTRVGPSGDSRELATQAQVALSITWVVIGAVVFAVGLVKRLSLVRVFGLGLLAIATAKVFLFDLSALDVAYRVLSFIGLGGVLLASSFVSDRFRSTGRQDSGAEIAAREAVAEAPSDL